MIFGVPISEVGWLLAGVLGGGVVTGLMAGLFGIGGGAVIVPVLFEVFRVLGVPDEVRMQLCVGTSLAIMKRPVSPTVNMTAANAVAISGRNGEGRPAFSGVTAQPKLSSAVSRRSLSRTDGSVRNERSTHTWSRTRKRLAARNPGTMMVIHAARIGRDSGIRGNQRQLSCDGFSRARPPGKRRTN